MFHCSLNPVGRRNNRNKASSFNCLRQCWLLSTVAFALTIGVVFAKWARATLRSWYNQGLFSACTRSTAFPPSFPFVRNLYFISELWSSSAQLSADKAQEALERRHGYLDGDGGELENERQAGRDPTPLGQFALATLYFSPFSPFLFFSFPSLTASPYPLPSQEASINAGGGQHQSPCTAWELQPLSAHSNTQGWVQLASWRQGKLCASHKYRRAHVCTHTNTHKLCLWHKHNRIICRTFLIERTYLLLKPVCTDVFWFKWSTQVYIFFSYTSFDWYF